jgi:hypothetical protein
LKKVLKRQKEKNETKQNQSPRKNIVIVRYGRRQRERDSRFPSEGSLDDGGAYS